MEKLDLVVFELGLLAWEQLLLVVRGLGAGVADLPKRALDLGWFALAPRAVPAAEILTAAVEQTVTVTGTSAPEKIIGRLAEQVKQLGAQRAEIETEILTVVDAHPLARVLTSMRRVGVRTAARILTELMGKDFATAGHLASYAGIAPVTRRSGTSVPGESPSRRGNGTLKRALLLSAFASINASPASRAYYDRKRAEGKHLNQAVIALA